ncbi:AAA family ATPase [Lentimicrobium sp. S6]|uniref:AAA family ATPase n=1 Tax=Lentimicrobium sp. S6 TaxID=2735872 RepID=UPI001556D7D9|nr:AAA family ATPase [Lentimicrobium sp. S6]NPD44073.1 AAA family ATPase [Lentimicrobium sp. S6]
MIIIGITGTLGAGKGSIVKYLTKEKGFTHFSVRGYLQKEMEKRGMPNNRDSMTSLANELRAQNSPSYVTDQLYFEALESGKNCIIESIRTPGEITSLREKGSFYLFAVDADAAVRYERIKLRASATDHISYETFLANEAREMNSTDPNKQNLKKCIEMADFSIDNNGDRNQLIIQTEKIIEKL